VKVNDAGIALLKSFESCRLKSYQDVVGIWTIGWGHTGGVGPDMEISQEEADGWLSAELSEVSMSVQKLIEVELNENQFSALVSFAYNVGTGNLKYSTLLKHLNAGDFAAAADEFLRWDKAGGKRYAGLARRRIAERALFLA
jgi:lysozyme